MDHFDKFGPMKRQKGGHSIGVRCIRATVVVAAVMSSKDELSCMVRKYQLRLHRRLIRPKYPDALRSSLHHMGKDRIAYFEECSGGGSKLNDEVISLIIPTFSTVFSHSF